MAGCHAGRAVRPGGFYARGERPAAHFRTSVHASPRYAGAILALLRHADAALGHPDRLDLVDIGAGQGELLSQVLALAQHLPAGSGSGWPGAFFSPTARSASRRDRASLPRVR